MMQVSQAVHDLVTIAIENGRIQAEDRIYQQNMLLRLIGVTNFEPVAQTIEKDPLRLLDVLLEQARQAGEINAAVNEDMMTALIMDTITPLPSQVNHNFWQRYDESPKAATDYFYQLSQQNDYIKTRAIAKNIHYYGDSPYGQMEITINLSKPEKDPKAIAAAAKLPTHQYPQCALCMENEGFFGSLNQAGRSNHRVIHLQLQGADWGFQYSPYAYFNEHAIVLNHEHRPMVVNRASLERLADFVEQFPHYMIGSNADLPIVGGSILTHDHYQAGQHEFPMAKASLRKSFPLADFPKVQAGIVEWPMSVIRLRSADKYQLIDAAERVMNHWNHYSQPALLINAFDAVGQRHHTITPIMRRRGADFELDLVLRDNNISAEFPDGIFHPHPDVQHIKKENIGLIEVMGLAILPPRLVPELAEIKKALQGFSANVAPMHQPWLAELQAGSFDANDEQAVDQYVDQAVADVFTRVLEDAGVFKKDATGEQGFDDFIASLNK